MTERRTTVLFDVWMLSHITAGLLDEALAGSGFGGDDFGLYSLLLGWAPATPSDVARWSGMRANTVSVALKRIEGRGHLDRHRNPEDGRSSIVALNERGRAAHANASQRFLETAEAVDSRLSDTGSLRSALQSLDTVLRQVANAGPRPYSVPEVAHGTHRATDGPPLTDAQEREVQRYIAWLRSVEE